MKFKRKKPEQRKDKPSTTLVKYIESVNKVAHKNKYTFPNFAQTYMPIYTNTNQNDPWRTQNYQQNIRPIYTYSKGSDQRYKTPNSGKIVYKQHEYHKHPLYTKLHRISRRDLYLKLEQLFTA